MVESGVVDKEHPAEVLNWREKNSKTFWLGKDNFKLVTRMHPVHYKGNDGTWNDLDPTIVDGVVTKSPYYARILKNKIGYVGTDSDGKKMELELINAKYVEPIIGKNKVTYKNIALDTDFEIKFRIGKIQANKILHSKKGEKKSVFRSYREEGIKGKLLNLGWDSEGKNTKLTITEEKTSREDEKIITQVFDGLVMKMNKTTRKREWSDKITYPVTIDPSYVVDAGADDGVGYETGAINANVNQLTISNETMTPTSSYPRKGGWLRFTGVTIPASPTVTSAILGPYMQSTYGFPFKLQLDSREVPNNPANGTQVVSPASVVGTVSPAPTFVNRTSFDWSSNASAYDQASFDFTSLVHTLANTHDYSAGGEMVFYVNFPDPGTLALAMMYNYDWGPTRAATLVIAFSAGATSRRRIIIAC